MSARHVAFPAACGQAAFARPFACHSGIVERDDDGEDASPAVPGTLEEPPALHAATASAATSGAKSFTDPFTEISFFRSWSGKAEITSERRQLLDAPTERV
jgi:hypothetical protein